MSHLMRTLLPCYLTKLHSRDLQHQASRAQAALLNCTQKSKFLAFLEDLQYLTTLAKHHCRATVSWGTAGPAPIDGTGTLLHPTPHHQDICLAW